MPLNLEFPFVIAQLVVRYQDTIVGQLFGVSMRIARISDPRSLSIAAHEYRPLLLD